MFISAQAYWLICALAAQCYHVAHEPWKVPWNHRSSWISLQGIPCIFKTKKRVRQLSEDRWSLQYEVYCMEYVCRLDLFLKGKQANKQAEVSSVSFRPRIWQEKYGIKCRVPAGSSKKREKQRNKRVSVDLVSCRVFGVGLRCSREGRPVRSA